jgi:hypothetical protein
MRLCSIIGASICAAAVCVSGAWAQGGSQPRADAQTDKDITFMLDGVSEIGAPGVPGPLCVFGPKAFPIVVGKAAEGVYAPVVAAVYAGRGRIVAYGHDGYFSAETLAVADTGRLMVNAFRWAAGPRVKPDAKIGVRHQPELEAYLNQQGFKTETLDEQTWCKSLGPCAVVYVSSHGLSDDEIAALQDYVAGGGGLVTGGLGWGWQQLNPTKDLRTDHPGNKLLAPAGIVWADGYFSRTSDNGYEIADAPSKLTHAARALDALVAHADGKTELTKEEMAQAAWIATNAVRALPPDDKILLQKFREIARTRSTDAIPSPDKPLKMDQPLARVIVAMQLDAIKDLPPEQVAAHPAAEAFPGAVPKDAVRGSAVVEVDTAVPGWHSTGLYAAPGELVKVGVDEQAAGKGLGVRIGCHTDQIWDADQWRRCPEITRQFPITSAITNAANAFGGLVYIEVPENCTLGTIPVRIGNVVQAPRYVQGKTSIDEWRKAIRNYPGPWAELETSKVILTVPSEYIRKLDSPDELMTFWDRVLDADADLATRPRERKRPERYVTDTQISAGYMHAGYPIMTHLDIAPVLVDKAAILANEHGGIWGLFHEMGHNHQSPDWTFDGTGEVTVNLFTLYVYETVCNRPTGQHPALNGDERAKKLAKYFADGAKFDDWKRDPFLALIMYMQLEEAFGWDAFKNVFAEYGDLPDAERPKTDDEKRDQWMVRFSRQVGRNLGPFFEVWGVPVSDDARAAIADLPDWMPDGFPPKSEGSKQ